MTDFGDGTEERLEPSIRIAVSPAPRFMTDVQLRAHFGLSERALNRLRMTKGFPRKDALVNKTDRKAVDRYFDVRAGLVESHGFAVEDGAENFGN